MADPAGLAAALRAFVECWPDPDDIPTGVSDAANLLESQAARIAELEEAFKKIITICSVAGPTSVLAIARRALASKEVDRG